MNLITKEFDILQNKIIRNYFKELGSPIKNIITYLDVTFPILFSYENKNKIYLSYILSYDDYDQELNLITTVIPDYEILKDMITAEKSIFDLFDAEYEECCLYFGYKRKQNMISKFFSEEIKLIDKAEKLTLLPQYHSQDYLVEDLLPEEDFYLKKDLINKVSLNVLDFYFELLLRSSKEKDLNYNASHFEKYNYSKTLTPRAYLIPNNSLDVFEKSPKDTNHMTIDKTFKKTRVIKRKDYEDEPKKFNNSNGAVYSKLYSI